jgi:hypothetical protein
MSRRDEALWGMRRRTARRGNSPIRGWPHSDRSTRGGFLGRDRAAAQLAGRLAECLPGGGPLFVVAPSGAGKSSLLHAGLHPALDRGVLPQAGSRYRSRTVLTPTARPMLALASQLTAALNDTPAGVNRSGTQLRDQRSW